MSRLRFEWCCNKERIFSQWEIPCEGCDRSCDNLIKVSPHRGIFGIDRDKIFQRDKCCLKCERKDKLTIDHIIPISKNGSNHISNLQTLCEKCNSKKSNNIIDYRK